MALYDIENWISPLVEEQFPAIYRTDGPIMVAFVKAYYEFLEQSGTSNTPADHPLYVSRNILEYGDVDQSIDDFLEHFRRQYLFGFPKTTSQTKPFILKHIMDVYRSKGTPRAVELLVKLVFGKDSQIYIPGKNLMRTSVADYYDPKYLEVQLDALHHQSVGDDESDMEGFVGQTITGSISEATAVVESALKTSVKGKNEYVFYISTLSGNFQRAELISHPGSAMKPKIIGSLSGLTLTESGDSMVVGDEMVITSAKFGINGKARVTGTKTGTGKAAFTVTDGGFGFSTNASLSNVLISTATVAVNTFTNSNATFRADFGGNVFYKLEKVHQPVEVVNYTTANTYFANSINTATYVIGTNSSITSPNSTNYIANGRVGIAQNTGANGVVTMFLETGTFGNQIHYYHQSNTIAFEVGEKVSVNSSIFGYLNAANSTVLTINNAANGFSNLVTQQVTGERSGAVSNGISAASKLVQTGVKKLFVAGNATLNSNSTAYENAYRTGTIVGGNTTAIGLVDNSTSYFISGPQNFIYGANTNTRANVVATRLGSDATMTISTLAVGTETKNVYTDFISTNNSANTSMLDVVIDGSNSGVGIVNSVTISAGGSGYANSDALVFANGGITNGALPSLNAIGTVTTNSTGGITSVTLTGHGNGYYHAPAITITTSAGSSGTLTPVMKYGYGLPKTGNTINTTATSGGGIDNQLNDSLTYSQSVALGSINSFSFTPGNNYTAAPFALPQNRFVDKFNQRNANISYDNFSGSSSSGFEVDDVIIIQTQNLEQKYINVSSVSGTFTVGEGAVHVFNGSANVFGTVTAANSTVITIKEVKRRDNVGGDIQHTAVGNSVAINASANLTGLDSLATANISGDANVAATRSVQGRIVQANTSNTWVEVMMYDTQHDFKIGATINKTDYTKQANLNSYYYLVPNTNPNATGVANQQHLGLNANITVDTTLATGVIDTIEILQSGYGYVDGETLTLTGGNTTSNVTATAVVNAAGIAIGHHRDNQGFLNEDKYLHDNDFYQEHSYQVRVDMPLDKYEKVIKDVVHLAGTRLFGKFQSNSEANLNISVANSSVSQA